MEGTIVEECMRLGGYLTYFSFSLCGEDPTIGHSDLCVANLSERVNHMSNWQIQNSQKEAQPQGST
jgi:hypothetical protein